MKKRIDFSKPINTLDDYTDFVKETSILTEVNLHPVAYAALGMTGEAGEVSDKVKKIFRDKNGVFSEIDRLDIERELGDTLWYLTLTAKELGYSLKDVVRMNVSKIKNRYNNGTIHGNGDNR